MTVHIRFFAGVLCLVKVGGHQQLLRDMAQGASDRTYSLRFAGVLYLVQARGSPAAAGR